MANVQVWNDGDYDLVEIFKGDKITIKAHTFKIMEQFEANDYRGQYYPMVLDASGLQDPRSYKKIRIVPIVDGKPESKEEAAHVCMACNKKYESDPVLRAHIDTAHADVETLVLHQEDEIIAAKRGRPKKAS